MALEPNCICVTCGKKFRKVPSELKERNFCCNKCYHMYRKGQKLTNAEKALRSTKLKAARKAPAIEVTCATCGVVFKTIPSVTRKYCSSACVGKAQKGVPRTPEVKQKLSKILKGLCVGEKNYRWHGNYIDKYKHVKCPVDFIAMANSGGYVLEHRLVVAKALGRSLKKSEIVHHIDDDTLNNVVENLALFKSAKDHASYHRGGKAKPIWTGS